MWVAELEACQVPEDPTFPTPTDGYVVSFYGFLRVGIRHASAPVHPLNPVVLRPGASLPNSLGSPAHSFLRDPM
jgi:hypothetical protein